MVNKGHITVAMAYLVALIFLSQHWLGNVADKVREIAGVKQTD